MWVKYDACVHHLTGTSSAGGCMLSSHLPMSKAEALMDGALFVSLAPSFVFVKKTTVKLSCAVSMMEMILSKIQCSPECERAI
mmetsp:Transcript_11642/g.34227  ORF Transcript_11642/g.34227 Transcript_11642/m.34227 type:complete len:83 (-) Transcript_11642:234-482(-)